MTGRGVSQLEHFWWLNGEPQSPLSIKDRGLAYGDGLFETMRCENGQIPFLPLHLARFERGLKALALPASFESIASQIHSFSKAVTAQAQTPAIIKLIVSRGVGGRGYAPSENAQPTVILQAFVAPLVGEDSEGVSLAVSRVALAEQQWLAGIKHLNRLEYVLAAADVQNRCPEATALLLNNQGHVIESLHHNLFCVQGGHVYTPALNLCGVAGVLRRWLLDDLAPELSLPCLVLPITLDELSGFDEVFIGNSVRGFMPVTQIITEGQKLSFSKGPVCQQLQRAFLAKLAQ